MATKKDDGAPPPERGYTAEDIDRLKTLRDSLNKMFGTGKRRAPAKKTIRGRK